MNVLAIGAHPDDIELGCAGWLARLVKEGHLVSTLVMSMGMQSRGDYAEELERLQGNMAASLETIGAKHYMTCTFPDQEFDSIALLWHAKRVEIAIEELKPSVVITHSAHDLNIDHRITHQAVLIATRPPSCVKEIYAYEICSSSEWNFGNVFIPNHFIDISETIDAKLEALKCYETEMREWPHPRSIEGVKTLAKYRGMQCGVEYAEAFQLVRRIP